MGTARMKTARILPVMMTMEIMMRIIRTMGVTGIQVRNSTGVGETKEKPPNRGCCQMTAAFFCREVEAGLLTLFCYREDFEKLGMKL